MKLTVVDLGLVPYAEAHDLQLRLALARREGRISDTLLMLEHPPTITVSRNADPSHIVETDEELKERGVARVETDRGGDVTYHGPGQLVGYPILDLSAAPRRPDLHAYFRQMEQAIIEALAPFEIAGERFGGYTGVWVLPRAGQPKKIAAMGIRVSRWITRHGFALNVCPRLDDFAAIVPCGIHDYGVTSMERLLQRPIAVAEVAPVVVTCFANEFGAEPQTISRAELEMLLTPALD